MSQRILPAAHNHPQLHGIPNWPGYFAGTDGSIWSSWCRKNNQAVQGSDVHQLSAAVSASGHWRVCLHRNGRKYTQWVHRLVLEAFVGECPQGMQCRHLNGNPDNNSPGNLQWGTRRENLADTVKHLGLVTYVGARGVSNSQVKLTLDDVTQIRDERRVSGTKPGKLARKFGISRTQVRRILSREQWSDVE